MREEGLLAGATSPEEAAFEAGIRPQTLDEFVGQGELKERLSILVEAARGRGESVDHVLFSGPPGLGKTTLAAILAREMDAQMRTTSGPALERPGDLAAILSNLEAGDVMFIDEVHRLPRPVEEILYTAMEDFELDIVVGKGAGAHSIRLELPHFSLEEPRPGSDECRRRCEIASATSHASTTTAPPNSMRSFVDRRV